MIGKFSDNLVVISTGKKTNYSGMIDYHYHEQTEFYFLLSGKCDYFIGNKIYSIEPLQLVIIPAFMIHKTRYRSKEHSRTLISVKKDFLDFEPSFDLTKPAIYQFNDQYNKEISNILNKIEYEVTTKDNFSEKMCKCLCFELFSIITRHGTEITSNTEKVFNSEEISLIIEKIMLYITEHYMENISLSTIAEDVGLSDAYLSKLFKKVTGLGFKEYLITVRILNAKKLLKETTYPVSRIAFDCGFNDSNYFSKMFHQLSDCTPLQYRKRKQK